MPFCLHGLDRTNDLFESVQSPAPLHQCQGVFAMRCGFEDEVCERPPVQVIQVEVAVHGWAAVAGDDATQGDHTAVYLVWRDFAFLYAGGDGCAAEYYA